jgi:hypothetical protein
LCHAVAIAPAPQQVPEPQPIRASLLHGATVRPQVASC